MFDTIHSYMISVFQISSIFMHHFSPVDLHRGNKLIYWKICNKTAKKVHAVNLNKLLLGGLCKGQRALD